MITWWNNLDLFARVYALIAIPSTLILLVQTVLLLFGLGGGESGVDLDGDGVPDTPDAEGSDGLSLFTVRGVMGFLTVGGWSGLALYASGVSRPLTVLLSFLCGTAALLGIGCMMRAAMKLQSSGNIQLGTAIGKVGRVYIPIPPKAGGSGKITLTLQERFLEADAVTTAERRLTTGEAVRIVSTNEAGMLVVEPLDSGERAG